MTDETTNVSAVTGGTVREYLSNMGPSWVAGAIAAGPATMASLIAAGAGYNYTLLWVVVLSAAAGAFAQYLAMRLGLLTERGIVGVVEDHIGETWAWILVVDVVIAAGVAQLVIMNTAASVSATLTGIDARVWGLIWAVVLAIGLAGRGYRFVELLAKVLVTAVVLAFVASLLVVPVDYGAAASGLVPSLPTGSALIAAGVSAARFTSRSLRCTRTRCGPETGPSATTGSPPSTSASRCWRPSASTASRSFSWRRASSPTRD